MVEEENPHPIEQIRMIYKQLNLLMINTKEEISASQKAKILFWIHLSKLNVKSETFNELFMSFRTIIITTGKNSTYDISSTKSILAYSTYTSQLAYFSTQISQLYGFAGINEIYLNIQLLNLFYLNLSKKY